MSNLLVVVMMVKNEAHVIEKTLQPLIAGGVQNFLMLDTGSTDDTVKIARQYFDSQNVNGIIEQEPFVDFATSRNRSLEYAEKHFMNASFFLIVDADWDVKNVPKLFEFCESEKQSEQTIYAVRIKFRNNLEFRCPILFRANASVRYVGAVHETPEQPPGKILVDDDVVCIVNDDQKHQRKSKERFQRDLEMLFKDLKKNPASSRTLFYLGQTYECLGDMKNAYKYYFKRSLITNITGAETAMVFFRLGYLTEHLAQTNTKFTWNMAMEYYMKSFATSPARIEGLIGIAAHYMNSMPHISFVYLKYVYAAPMPEDFGLVLKEVYLFLRYELLSKAAGFMREYELGKEATELALKYKPDDKNLLHRLTLYENALKLRDTNDTTGNAHMHTPKPSEHMSSMLM